MPKPDSRATFALGEPRFFSIEAYAQTKDHEPHVTWFASYEEAITDGGYRTVVATLHAATEDASTTVTLGGHFYWASGSAQPKTRERLEELS